MVKNFTVTKSDFGMFQTKGLELRSDISIISGRHQPIIILKIFELVEEIIKK
jgi:hypothetical protein